MIVDRIGHSADMKAFEALVKGVYFPAKGQEGREMAIWFLDQALDADGGEVPLRTPVEWRRRFRAFRAAKGRPVRSRRIAPVVVIGRQRVAGRFYRPQRRRAGLAKSSVSSDDGGGGDGPPTGVCSRAALTVTPGVRVAS